jgi:hypothetical protein
MRPPIRAPLIKLLSREDAEHYDHTNAWFPDRDDRIRVALQVTILVARGIIDPLLWHAWAGHAGLWVALLFA